jgi:hypothetical protein
VLGAGERGDFEVRVGFSTYAGEYPTRIKLRPLQCRS